MKLRVLECSGAEFPGFRPPGYLLDDVLLLDAGTIGAVLGEEEQRAIRNILVTHAHLDHIRGIPLLAGELAKARKLPSIIFVVHPKPQHREDLAAELSGISVPGLSLLRDGEIHRL
jgi:glyoxylase-like metal-dependent hydrolase (beta-lactamase superfamily II)